VQKTGIKFES